MKPNDSNDRRTPEEEKDANAGGLVRRLIEGAGKARDVARKLVGRFRRGDTGDRSAPGTGAKGTGPGLSMFDGVPEMRQAARKLAKRSATGGNPRDPQTNLLNQTEKLEEASTSYFTRTSLVMGSALVVFAIAWAKIAKLDEVASGPGEIVPAGSVKVVQHLEGGIVAKINVRDGDLVKKGQVLMRLRSAAAKAELAQLRAREITLILRANRLEAFVSGKPTRPLSAATKARYASLIKEEAEVLRLQEKTRRLQRLVIERQIEQRRSQLKILRETEASLRNQFKVVKESLRLREAGTRKGVVPRALYLQTQREYERVLGEINEAVAKIGRTRQELAEARARLAEHNIRTRTEAMTERGKVLGELAEVREKLATLRDRVSRLAIRAPVRGYVKGLRVKNEGAVITADGKPVMEIVPADRKLVVEARISTRDVGHVKVGQLVKIKVDTYDFARYGALNGRVKDLSATSFLDKDGRPYFRAIVTLARNHMGRVPGQLPLTPGMTVTADVVTGTKSVLAYIIKPVYVAINSGLRER